MNCQRAAAHVASHAHDSSVSGVRDHTWSRLHRACPGCAARARLWSCAEYGVSFVFPRFIGSGLFPTRLTLVM